MKHSYKSKRGITLIGLIATVIVMLVLIGVSINLILGENGIIERTITAKQSTIDNADKEQVQLDLQSELIQYSSDLSLSASTTFRKYLSDKYKINSTSDQIQENNRKFEYDDLYDNFTYTAKSGRVWKIDLTDDGIIKNIFIDESSSNKNTQEAKLNVILMIGDGMGQNHIKAGDIYKGESLYMQTIPYYTDVTTYSANNAITDSAASATAMATGKKTNNYYLGKDKNGTNQQNLTELAKRKGMKTGVVATQTIYHATPAGFTAHTTDRSNYPLIARRQITKENVTYTKEPVDLMLGGGQDQFNSLTTEMKNNGYTYITNFAELAKCSKNEHVIGAFSGDRMTIDALGHAKYADPSLEKMTRAALDRLENENGFFVMIEGSDIDTYSHKGEMQNMLNELICFDEAVKVAKDYVDKHPNTLLLITADHETGGLDLEGVTTKEQLFLDENNDGDADLFTSPASGGNKHYHTNNNVLIYAYGNSAENLVNSGTIDNTYIYTFISTLIINSLR